MNGEDTTEAIVVHAVEETVEALDTLADATERSRRDVVNQALDQSVQTNAWQIERIKDGLAAARSGRVRPAENVFADIGARHGWSVR